MDSNTIMYSTAFGGHYIKDAINSLSLVILCERRHLPSSICRKCRLYDGQVDFVTKW